MSAEIMAETVAKISWMKVAAAVSSQRGRTYSPQYICEIARGFRRNKAIEPILRDLGVPLQQRLSVKAHNQMLAQARKDTLEREAAGTLRPVIDEVDLLYRQRRTLARHLLESLRESRALRAELEESQSRAAATALRLGNEITEKISKIEKEYARVDAERACLELELSQTRINLELKVANARLQLEESRLTNDRLIARLSKQSRSRRVTHIRIGNELFRNRTGASA